MPRRAPRPVVYVACYRQGSRDVRHQEESREWRPCRIEREGKECVLQVSSLEILGRENVFLNEFFPPEGSTTVSNVT